MILIIPVGERDYVGQLRLPNESPEFWGRKEMGVQRLTFLGGAT